MTREEANAELNRIEDEILSLEARRVAIATEHNLVIYGDDPDATATFFPTVEAFREHYNFGEGEMEWIVQEHSFPGWISSSSMC